MIDFNWKVLTCLVKKAAYFNFLLVILIWHDEKFRIFYKELLSLPNNLHLWNEFDLIDKKKIFKDVQLEMRIEAKKSLSRC